MTDQSSLSRPQTTLFLIMSVDGRITSHDSDALDPNKAWKQDPRIRARLQQFYQFASGGIYTVTYGDSLVGSGINTRTGTPDKIDANLILIDHPAHLNRQGVNYLAKLCHKLYLVSLKSHPALKQKTLPKNFTPITFSRKISLKQLLHRLHEHFGVEQVSIQSNARLNARWLSGNLVDYLSVIVSPLLVGRHGTPNLIDQEMLHVKPLELIEVKPVGFGFVNLRYRILND